MSFEYFEGLEPDGQARYKQKLQLLGLTTDGCPYKYPANSWTDDPTKWPEVEYGDIYSYLIETPGMERNGLIQY
jgi:hypothetical protein